ncbi:GH3 auxin-responsive promoter family protein [Solitalea koreensis]|uniref:Phenylacetate-coenzyme A ligase PaaK, adenylate-forming domain family n=1 Tax=Solitalea koreensis TaxID=543615 RepID=A0A521BJM4_9SPHI|nr:GH3 auxin-responsive promoter family protein [Solitalea koreensis]SMO47293.1 Phenylacetate-coenzyme A ligase PaaK, adenylate-forming domain family [Solitalea koreensis]
MGIKAALSKPYANLVSARVNKWKNNAVALQDKWMHKLLSQAKQTAYGRDHHFSKIHSYEDFIKQVPIVDYEDLRPYIDRVVEGEKDVLWPGKPLYFAKTSGTTSGVKYIPISKESMPEHINAARNALLLYIAETGNADFVDGKMIFLQGSPEMEEKNGIKVGRLSGISAHHVPAYLQKNRMPSYETNCMDDWEQKVNAIVDETINENMSLISGIPPWVQMYFDRLAAKTGKKIKDIFPNFNLFIHGGVNFEPYRAKLEAVIGRKVDSIETYPASEGFIAFQDSQKEKGLLLNVDAGIFFEFIPTEEYFNENPTRLSLKDVELDKNYAIILNTNAGLWGYSIGDTVKFVSKEPYRIVVSGRIKHYISAFGEHVIGEEVEYALMKAAEEEGVDVVEFTVAPQVNDPDGGLPFHEWFVEFGEHQPENPDLFMEKVDKLLQEKNVYYFDLIDGKILQPLKIRMLKKGAFIDYMRSQGKLGGQNKVPRLSNDRKIADELVSLTILYKIN